MSYRVISSILKGNWAIDPLFAESYIPIIENVLNGKMGFDFDEFKPVGYAHFEECGAIQIDFNSTDENGNIEENSVGIINVVGVLMKYDQDCGPIGMAKLVDIIKSMDSNPKIKGIVLKIDSPGGTVDGTQQLAESVKTAKKPVVTFIDDLMASAALWIGTSAKEVYAGKENDEIGSIGVMLSFADLKPAYERLGVKFHSIVADQSTDKNKLFEQVRAGQYDQYKKDVLNPLANDFINAVKSNRPNVKDDQLTGKMFFARDLVGTLIDGIKSFDDVIKRVFELSKNNKQTNKNNNKNSSMKKFSNINKAVGAELEIADGGIFLTEDQAEKVETGLVQNEQTATDLQTVKTEKEQADKDLQTSNETIQQKDAKITELEGEVAELRKGAGASSANLKVNKEVSASEEDGPAPVVSFDESLEERITKMNAAKG